MIAVKSNNAALADAVRKTIVETRYGILGEWSATLLLSDYRRVARNASTEVAVKKSVL
jgi:hypothetical protein